jgi:hypothetical protein
MEKHIHVAACSNYSRQCRIVFRGWFMGSGPYLNKISEMVLNRVVLYLQNQVEKYWMMNREKFMLTPLL